MLLRRVTTHVKNQNWVAVGLDFIIVVLGVAIAMLAQQWLADQQARDEMKLAEVAIEQDLFVNYFNAKERVAGSSCRIAALRDISGALLQPGETWTGRPRATQDGATLPQALPELLRSPNRNWGSQSWQAELARGTFNKMDNARRSRINQLFEQSHQAEVLQTDIYDLQGRLKTLAISTTINRSDRLRYLDMLGELDVKSGLLELISSQMIVSIEQLELNLDSILVNFDATDLANFNAAAKDIYGDCYASIEIPGLGTR